MTTQPPKTRLARIALAFAALTAGVVPAFGAITTPGAGATVRGYVLINEDRGGVSDSACVTAQQLLGAPKADSTITVTRASNSQVVLAQSKGDGGAWSTTWDSTAETANGFFTIKSVATDRRATLAGGFCYGAVKTTLTTITVYLENFTPFVDDRGNGTILINPYLKQFRFIGTSYDSGNRSDPDMQFESVPAVPAPPCDPATNPQSCVPAPPALPGLAPACGDPTSAGFLPYVVANGPQGCLSPNPLPKLPPDPPNPPAPPSSQCDIPGTGGCSGTVVFIKYRDADITLNGFFDVNTRNFAASVVLADGSAFALSRAGSP